MMDAVFLGKILQLGDKKGLATSTQALFRFWKKE
jgi:hypothetical protein